MERTISILGMGRRLTLLLTLFLPLPVSTLAQRSNLRGVKEFAVVVEELKGDVVHDGLTTQQIKTDAELRLRKAGMTVKDSSDDGYDYYISGLPR